MNQKKPLNHLNPFNITYTEKSAIHGHSVDRYNYAMQLIEEGSNESLIKAYAWLVIASEEVDRKKASELMLHRLGFELKKRGVFNLAKEASDLYMSKYSRDAMWNKILKSKNPLNYLVRLIAAIGNFIDNQVEFFDSRIIKNKGSLSAWKKIAFFTWLFSIGAFMFWNKNSNILTSSFLVFSMMLGMLSFMIMEKREEAKNNS